MLAGLVRIHRALVDLGLGELHVRVFDPDSVTPANVGRQLFYPGDIGANKAIVLCSRINAAFGLQWAGLPIAYTGEAEPTKTRVTASPYAAVITCVDTTDARRSIAAEWARHPAIDVPCYWLDCGNRAKDGQVVLGQPADVQQFLQGQLTADELRDFVDRTGGRLATAVGQPRLPTVIDLFPEAFAPDVTDDDDGPSCSLAEALGRQDLFINDWIAKAGLDLLWRLFRNGEIDRHGYMVSLDEGVVPIRVEQSLRRMASTPKTRRRRAARIYAAQVGGDRR
jgi:PRTRC genetic system ThiF family protein